MPDSPSPVTPTSTPPAAAPLSSGGTHDMFEAVDPTSGKAGGPHLPEPLQALPELEAVGRSNRVLVWVGAGVAVLILAAVGWLAYSRFAAPSAEQPPVVNAPAEPSTEQPGGTENPSGEEPGGTENPDDGSNGEVTPPPVTDTDFDRDGLTNADEEQLGTDPNSSDSDGDRLYDRDEVRVWHTDPLNPDSDGDSYLDGDEVNNGYDPLGPGQLLTIPPAT